MTTDLQPQPFAEPQPDYQQTASIIRQAVLELLHDPDALVAEIIAEACNGNSIDLDDDKLDEVLKSISVIVDSKKLQQIAERQKP